MVDYIRNFFTLVGMGTVGIAIYFLCLLWWDKWGQYWFRFHKHLYHVHSIWQINDTERGCEKWSICFKCEKCNKEKEISFWNDKIKLKTVKDDEQND